jgi:hypothetical protein
VARLSIAANSADTFPRIAELWHGVVFAVRQGTLEELEPNITAYQNSWKEARHPGIRHAALPPAAAAHCRR